MCEYACARVLRNQFRSVPIETLRRKKSTVGQAKIEITGLLIFVILSVVIIKFSLSLSSTLELYRTRRPIYPVKTNITCLNKHLTWKQQVASKALKSHFLSVTWHELSLLNLYSYSILSNCLIHITLYSQMHAKICMSITLCSVILQTVFIWRCVLCLAKERLNILG